MDSHALLAKIALEVIAPVILMAGIGFILGWRRVVDPEPIAKLYVVAFAPALAFMNIIEATFTGTEFVQIIVFAGLTLVVLFAVGQIASKVLGHDRGMRGAFTNSVILYNSANYGLPVQQQAFGDYGGLVQAIVLICQSFTAFTLGVFLAASDSPSLWTTLKRVAMVPLIWALVLGAVCRGLHVTAADLQAIPLLWNPLTAFKSALVPVALVSLGVQLSRVRIHGRVRDIAVGTVLRLLIGPLAGAGVGLAMSLVTPISHQLLAVLIVSVSFPTAVMSSVLATQFRNHSDYSAATVFVSTCASILTVTATIYMTKVYLVAGV